MCARVCRGSSSELCRRFTCDGCFLGVNSLIAVTFVPYVYRVGIYPPPLRSSIFY